MRLLSLLLLLLSALPCEAQRRRIVLDRLSNPILFRYSSGDSTGGATFTNASANRSYTDANGTIQYAGVNVLRDAHYISGVRTTLLEGARTNLLLRSEEFDNATWAKSALSVPATNTVAPDGASTADTITEDGTLAGHNIAQTVTKAASATTYTLTVYLKTNGRSAVVMVRDAGVFGNRANFGVNLSNGSVGLAATALGAFTAASGSVTAATNGWYRVALTFTTGTETSLSCRIYLDDGTFTSGGTNYTGNGTSGLFAWGAQLEAGSFASSYIPTTAATVTRAADSYADTQQVAPQELTQYDRYYNQATAAFVDSVTTITAGSNYPTQPTTFRAYRYRVVAKGVRDLAWFQGRGFTP